MGMQPVHPQTTVPFLGWKKSQFQNRIPAKLFIHLMIPQSLPKVYSKSTRPKPTQKPNQKPSPEIPTQIH